MKTACFFLICLCLIISCGQNKKEVLAKVGTEIISVVDYQELYSDLQFNRSQLNEMIENKLLYLGGLKLGLEKDSAVIRGLDTYKKGLLLEALYDEVVTKKAKVLESEVKDLYNKIKEQYQLAQIVLDDNATAQMVYDELLNGVPFETLAVKHSTDEQTRMYGGNIGFVSVQSLDPLIFDKIKPLKPDEFTKPFPFQDKILIVKMIEHKEVDLPKYETIKDNIQQRLEIEKKNKLAQEFIDWVFEKAMIEFNQKGLDILVRPDSLLKPEDLNEWVVKKYKTKTVSVKTLRPSIKRLYDLYGFDPKQLVERELQPDLLNDEALRRNLDRRAEFMRRIKKGLEELIVQKCYDQEILGVVNVDSTDMFNYYQEHKKEFNQPYNKVRNEIWSILQQQKLAARKEEYLASLRGEYPVEIYEKLIEKLEKENQ